MEGRLRAFQPRQASIMYPPRRVIGGPAVMIVREMHATGAPWSITPGGGEGKGKEEGKERGRVGMWVWRMEWCVCMCVCGRGKCGRLVLVEGEGRKRWGRGNREECYIVRRGNWGTWKKRGREVVRKAEQGTKRCRKNIKSYRTELEKPIKKNEIINGLSSTLKR